MKTRGVLEWRTHSVECYCPLVDNVQNGRRAPFAWHTSQYRRPVVEAGADVGCAFQGDVRSIALDVYARPVCVPNPDKRRMDVRGNRHDGRTRCTWMGTNLVECQMHQEPQAQCTFRGTLLQICGGRERSRSMGERLTQLATKENYRERNVLDGPDGLNAFMGSSSASTNSVIPPIGGRRW